MVMPTRSYQIAQHAKALQRWFSPAEAKREATRLYDAGDAWFWPEPEQLDLFSENHAHN